MLELRLDVDRYRGVAGVIKQDEAVWRDAVVHVGHVRLHASPAREAHEVSERSALPIDSCA